MATRTIRATFKVGDVLTDATTAKLSDATGAYGVKRDDTDAVVVADATSMTKDSTGSYSYSFTSIDGVAYTAWVEFVYAGNTYRKEFLFEATTAAATDSMMASFTDLQERIARFAFGDRTITGVRTAAEILDINDRIQDGLRDVYSAHKWSFLYPVATVTTVSGTSLYSLPTGYDAMMGPLTYPAGSTDFYPPINLVSEAEIRKKQTLYTANGSPQYAAVVTDAFDPSVGSVRKLKLCPTPDAAYVLSAKVRLRPTMIDEDNPYPLGAETLAPVIVEACLAAAERFFRDEEGVHAETFKRLLAEAIETDKDNASPDYLVSSGEMADELDDRRDRSGTIMWDGEEL